MPLSGLELTFVSSDPSLTHPHTYLLELLLKNIPTNLSETCDNFFELLNKLIKDSCSGKLGGSPSKFTNLLETVIQAIKTRPAVEQHRADKEDKVLIGLMSIVYTLVSQDMEYKRKVGSPTGYLCSLLSYLLND